MEARLTRLTDLSGSFRGTVLTVRDVTKQKAEQALRADFLSLIAHKVRTPLTVLTGVFPPPPEAPCFARRPRQGGERICEVQQTVGSCKRPGRRTAHDRFPSELRVVVKDNGPGLPPEFQERVFDGFVQVEEQLTGQVPGLGMGLFLARQVARAYGGSIRLKSRLGRGCEVTFCLPAEPPCPEGVGA